MKKTQWAVLITALIVTILLYLLTQDKVFGVHPAKHSPDDGHGHNAVAELSADTLIYHAKENLTAQQKTRLSFLEGKVSAGNDQNNKLHFYHQLAVFWRDTARVFEPFAWYTAEASRLENSEKSLTFAAHLFLDNLRSEENPQLKRWKALQSKDLFERSLKINPRNDSSTVGLGATYLFGGLESPMEGIRRIRSVTEEHPDNIYAQLTMGEASMISGQTDKAIERFQTVLKLDPENLQAILSLADVYERKGDKQEAIKWYKKSLPIIKGEMIRQAIENRINELSL